MSNPLFDKEFLRELDKYPHRETHVRITSLDYDDVPIEQIEGICTGGSINVDGSSALRRTCSLSLMAPPNTAITEYYWAFNHKFKVEIGLTNYINSNYDSIIWFPQGIFIVNSFSKTESTTALTISISGQDKMCRLNGTISGKVPVEVDFAHEDIVQPDGSIITNKILLYNTIQMAVHEYGQERKSNILINDLDMQGLELWEYRGNVPLYLFYNAVNNEQGSVLGLTFGSSATTKASVSEYDDNNQKYGSWSKKKLSEIQQYYQLNTLDSSINSTASKAKYYCSGSGSYNSYVIRIEYGDNAGYHQTDLTYTGDLIAKAGTTITAGVLDKVKNMLGEYEYFYDLDGRFVFQKKKTYINELFSPLNGDIVEPMMTISPYSYEFDNKSMFTNISYSPQIANVKNDFVLWGTKANGTPIHARYAIQKKPTYYKTTGHYDSDKKEWLNGVIYYTTELGTTFSNGKLVDWRELIYQMARDYSLNNHRPDFYYRVNQQNIVNNVPLYPDGNTGFEHYYTDMLGYWRYLYDLNSTSNTTDRYYPYQEYYDKDHALKPGWNKMIHQNPENLIFWFDFLDVGEAPLNEFSVDSIGPRAHVESVSGNSSICTIETPEILFTVGDETVQESEDTSAYAINNLSEEKADLFNIASANVSLISKANELIYKYACCAEGVNLTCIPIYYLEPNTRIYVPDIGDLIVTKISYNLTHGGTMSLTCTKVVESIY